MGSVSGSRGYLIALWGYHLLRALTLKRICGAEVAQDKVKLIKVTTRVYWVALEEEGDGGRRDDMA